MKMGNKRLKICHITSAHNSSDVRIFEKECTSLAKIPEYQVFLVAPGESYVKNNVTVVGIGETPKNRLARSAKFALKAYKTALDLDADIYHLHDPELLQFALKIKGKGKKVIYDSHEDCYKQIREKYYIPKVARNLVADSYRYFETSVVKRIDAVIFPCLIKGKHPFEGRCKKTVLINNLPSVGDVLDKYDPNANKTVLNTVCYTGSLTEERGITNLIRACYKSGARLILAGLFSPSDYYDELKKMEEFSCVDYRGLCSREEIIDILSESYIGASVLQNKGQYPLLANLATKVYEFMAFSMPVIINDYEYGSKMVNEYQFGLTANADDVDDIADKISYLLNNPNIGQAMGQRGRTLVEEELNWNVEAEKLFNLYNELSED